MKNAQPQPPTLLRQADLDAGSVTNIATATNGTVTSGEATATVNAVKSPALSLLSTPYRSLTMQ